jgi:RNA polymerase sigma-70 factor (sigma-E family)
MADGSDSEFLAYVDGRVTALRRTAYLLCGNAHEADDIVQEALTKLYVRWPRRHSIDNLDAYVNTMLIRIFVDGRRRGWWKVALTNRIPDRAETAEQPMEERSEVRAALAELPPRQQAVLVLRFLCDQPVREVAELLNCSEGTVKSQTSVGLTHLRKLLGADAAGLIATRPAMRGAR